VLVAVIDTQASTGTRMCAAYPSSRPCSYPYERSRRRCVATAPPPPPAGPPYIAGSRTRSTAVHAPARARRRIRQPQSGLMPEPARPGSGFDRPNGIDRSHEAPYRRPNSSDGKHDIARALKVKTYRECRHHPRPPTHPAPHDAARTSPHRSAASHRVQPLIPPRRPAFGGDWRGQDGQANDSGDGIRQAPQGPQAAGQTTAAAGSSAHW